MQEIELVSSLALAFCPCFFVLEKKKETKILKFWLLELSKLICQSVFFLWKALLSTWLYLVVRLISSWTVALSGLPQTSKIVSSATVVNSL